MTLKSKMVTCTCGNTDLEKIGVRLQVTGEDGRTLSLSALICRGDGCGRVTFRPQENPKSESEPSAGKSTNGHRFAESARVIEGARLVEGAKLVESPRLVERPKMEEGARLIDSAKVIEGARLIETPKKAETAPKEARNTDGAKGVAALFERVYTERLVYKAIAERDPNCATLFDALKKNEQICSGITAAIGKVYERLDAGEDLLTALESLPSLAGK
jgi:hypothetical protein